MESPDDLQFNAADIIFISFIGFTEAPTILGYWKCLTSLVIGEVKSKIKDALFSQNFEKIKKNTLFLNEVLKKISLTGYCRAHLRV